MSHANEESDQFLNTVFVLSLCPLYPCPSASRTTDSCVGGIVVSIAAFQAVDPGSIPGQRNKQSHHASPKFDMSLLSQKCSEGD